MGSVWRVIRVRRSNTLHMINIFRWTWVWFLNPVREREIQLWIDSLARMNRTTFQPLPTELLSASDSTLNRLVCRTWIRHDVWCFCFNWCACVHLFKCSVKQPNEPKEPALPWFRLWKLHRFSSDPFLHLWWVGAEWEVKWGSESTGGESEENITEVSD